MKLILFFVQYLFFFALGKYSHLGRKKLLNKKRQTPKAFDLNDHFGYHPLDSPYGPQEQKVIYVSQPDSIALVSPCEVSLQPYYDTCSLLSSCGLCTASPDCGIYFLIKYL